MITCGRRKDGMPPYGFPSDFECEIVETDRGGKWTYHGPEQLMVYAIFNLTRRGDHHRPLRDVGWFVRSLESVFVQFLSDHFGISAQGCSSQPNVLNQTEKATGVWVNNQKLVSLGIAVKRWTTLHGAALCVGKNQPGFQFLNPCGFRSDVMTSLEEILATPQKGFRWSWEILEKDLEAQFRKSF